MTLKPWVYGPLELIKHAEEHRIANGDFDKRIALISYDDAIEVTIATYLSLHKEQRAGVDYTRAQVTAWLQNYHTRLDFFFDEFIGTSGQMPPFSKEEIIHYHKLRNDLYHEGKNVVPTERDINGARTAALYIFSELFVVDGAQLVKTSPMLHTIATNKINVHGKGNGIRKVRLREGLVTFNIKFRGTGFLNIELCDINQTVTATILSKIDTMYNSLISRTETLYGSSANIKTDGEYLLEVTTNSGSSWEVEIEQ